MVIKGCESSQRDKRWLRAIAIECYGGLWMVIYEWLLHKWLLFFDPLLNFN